MFQHDYLDTCCFECLICICFVFLYLHLFSAIEHVSHGKALWKYAHYFYYYSYVFLQEDSATYAMVCIVVAHTYIIGFAVGLGKLLQRKTKRIHDLLYPTSSDAVQTNHVLSHGSLVWWRVRRPWTWRHFGH